VRKHAFDPTSFILGLVVAGVAVVYLLAEASDRTVDGAWVFPVTLIGLGVAALAAGLSRAFRREPRAVLVDEEQPDGPPVADQEADTPG
jgi:hypothetical protein